MKLVLVPGACYRTDATTEQPAEVCLDPYCIGAYEVTFDEYERFTRDQAPDTGRRRLGARSPPSDQCQRL
jgi:formylglycine-generating enzyme required for sulfatase activity